MTINKKLKFLAEKINEVKNDLRTNTRKNYIIENLNLIKGHLHIVKGEEIRPPSKITRDAFLYTEKGDALCGSCVNYMDNKCLVVKGAISYKDSCNLYSPSKRFSLEVIKLDKPEKYDTNLYNKEEVGYTQGPVQCKNCYFLEKSSVEHPYVHCELFEKLNFISPEIFNLELQISPEGCCTAFKEKK